MAKEKKNKKKDSEKVSFHHKRGVTQANALKILKQKDLEYGVCILKTKRDVKKDDVHIFMIGGWFNYPNETIKAFVHFLNALAASMPEEIIIKYLKEAIKTKSKTRNKK